ncbi:MAG TPA: uracil-DNA glycosylase family protein [Thermoanaerobaculia bacterium]|nr:uracil-DNA glycosylase family protein [Thermoanaerobaculia bacterium]
MSGWQELDSHIQQVRGCRICPRVEPPPVIARPEIWPRMMLIGQAPGPRERDVGRSFAFTAGSRMFAWFANLGVSEEEFRRRVLIAAAIRCFPGRAPQGGDRPPAPDEIANCAPWLEEEIRLIRPRTIIVVGQHAIAKFIPEPAPLSERVGQVFEGSRGDLTFEVVPLPHPSGRSTWLVRPENQARLDRALERLARSPGWRETFGV